MYFTDYNQWLIKKSRYGAWDQRDEDFLQFIGDALAGLVQYGKREILCEFVLKELTGKPVLE